MATSTKVSPDASFITIEGIAVHEDPLTNTTFVHPSGVGVEVSEANILCNSPALAQNKLHNKNRNKNIFFKNLIFKGVGIGKQLQHP